jgi:hypothetical protein
MKRNVSRAAWSIWRTLGLAALATAALVLCGLFGRVGERIARADDVAILSLTQASPDQPISVRDRLIAGLQVRLQSEVTFIDHTLAAVQAGHLPQQMVDETFIWARQKASDPRHGRPRRPIIYFQPALVARANAINVTL